MISIIVRNVCFVVFVQPCLIRKIAFFISQIPCADCLLSFSFCNVVVLCKVVVLFTNRLGHRHNFNFSLLSFWKMYFLCIYVNEILLPTTPVRSFAKFYLKLKIILQIWSFTSTFPLRYRFAAKFWFFFRFNNFSSYFTFSLIIFLKIFAVV